MAPRALIDYYAETFVFPQYNIIGNNRAAKWAIL
jgi:hypothetical protein